MPALPVVAPPSASQRARAAFYEVLADPGIGFNPYFDIALESYELTPPEGAPIDWDVDGPQMFLAQMDIDMAEASTTLAYPCVMLYTLSSENQNLSKFNIYAGVVTLGIDFFLSFSQQGKTDFESYADAVEYAVLASVNGIEGSNAIARFGVAYNGNIRFDRLQVICGAENWRLTVKAVAICQISP
jgi:hypothetical protein